MPPAASPAPSRAPRSRSRPPVAVNAPTALPEGVLGFNLIDDPWILLSTNTQISLMEVFSGQTSPAQLAGTPVEKAAILKLLLAIAQAAATPADDAGWQEMGPEGLSQAATAYLNTHRQAFCLTGPKPFLQMPAIAAAEVADWAKLNPQYASGNTTVLTQWQQARAPTAPEVARMLVVLSSFAMGGKKTDNTVVLTPGYVGKTPTGRPGPSLGYMGHLHSFFWAPGVLETVWLNMLTKDDMDTVKPMFPKGEGTPPWEAMPSGEDDDVARALRASLMGRLVPLSRFCLIHPQGMHYSEGLPHRSHLEGVVDPSCAISTVDKKNTALWANPLRRPWRELPALMSLLAANRSKGPRCFGIDSALPRVRSQRNVCAVGVWSGGIRVKDNAGEKYMSIGEDMVESCVWIDPEAMGNVWFEMFAAQMQDLEALSRKIYGAINRYGSLVKRQDVAPIAQATNMFWQLCERQAQALVSVCAAWKPGLTAAEQKQAAEELQSLRRAFANHAEAVYDRCCPHVTGRQLEAWAQARPDLRAYRSAYATHAGPSVTALFSAPSPSNSAPTSMETSDGT